MKNIYLLLLYFGFGFAQNYQITYSEKINLSSGQIRKIYQKNSVLIFNHKESIYKSFSNMNPQKEGTDVQGNKYVYRNQKDTLHVYKNFMSNDIMTEKLLFGSYRIVLENMGLIKWDITNDKKDILGYECIKATTKFRGKEFEVFFAPKLEVSDGPYHFSGLPGVILYLIMKDEVDIFEVQATLVETTNKKISNPLNIDKAITFEAFKKLFQSERESIWLTAPNVGENKLSKGGIENLIDE